MRAGERERCACQRHSNNDLQSSMNTYESGDIACSRRGCHHEERSAHACMPRHTLNTIKRKHTSTSKSFRAVRDRRGVSVRSRHCTGTTTFAVLHDQRERARRLLDVTLRLNAVGR